MNENEVLERTETTNVTAEAAAQTSATGGGENSYFDYTGHSMNELDRKNETDSSDKKKKKKEKGERKSGGFFGKAVLCICLGLCFGACAGLGFHAVNKGINYFDKTEDAVQTNGTQLPDNLVKLPSSGEDGTATSYVTYVQNDVTNMVSEVMPAMVSIVNQYTSTGFNFWGQEFRQDKEASGSGIIVGKTDEALLIATNNHVVEGTSKLEVTFIDGSTADAVLKGTDPDMDLAVIAVPLKNLEADTMNAITVAKLGDSDSLKLGEPVVAIGNALGYGQSVTQGCISALNREIETEDGSSNAFIQTDAAINPGNSGGALLNINGEVIGINSSKIGGSTVEGMGYAIPISAASPILTELMERNSRVDKVDANEIGYMGVSLQTVTDDIAKSLGLPKGIFIKSVEADSPADKAGIQKGDIVVKLDGQRVSTADDLKNLLNYYKAGETISITVKRSNGGEYEATDLSITLGKRPE